ncbi:MAG: glycosyltransferase family 25 protein [Thermoflexibacter sp.]|jgi:glycosyl transferase family 25|nr:glycosyltransferase family 25 protein [Thermoflexibacter sp.]
MEIFVINLKEAQDRMQLIDKQLKELGLSYQRFEAVRGSQLSEQEMSQWCNMNAVKSNPTWLTKGAIGCALSHWKVYNQIVAENIPIALILEDDMQLPPHLPFVLQEIEKQIKDNEVILLYFQSFTEIHFSALHKTALTHHHELCYPMDISRLGAAGAYIITQKVAQKLVKALFPITAAADTWHFFHHKKAFDTIRCVIPFAVTSSFAESTIDYIKKDNFLGKVKGFLSAYNIFFVKDFLAWNRKKIWKKLTNYSFKNALSPLDKSEK